MNTEQQFIEQLLEEALAGRALAAFIAGDPGIGKTSLLEGLGAQQRRDCLALRGAPPSSARAAVRLIVDALDEYLGSLEPRAFSRLASEDLSELAGVFPALRCSNRVRLGPPPPPSASRRTTLRDLIERLAGPRPLVLVLEDLHWADGASLELDPPLAAPAAGAALVVASFSTEQVDRGFQTAMASAMASGDTVRHLELGPAD